MPRAIATSTVIEATVTPIRRGTLSMPNVKSAAPGARAKRTNAAMVGKTQGWPKFQVQPTKKRLRTMTRGSSRQK